eukprot:CAMPEP_0178634740 /NCGR_PEP_ID=MMETSP0698-20121128/12784_1 /TAXON_ID=265572 /ORGANISM="Extubocellulus spinifer, Strain CCMP396" /LENGTH=356 /DNA_ID=CAMNT_0020274413 /DNA_START=46 /DNA_END=1116 /DNA_ORIENTATION=+
MSVEPGALGPRSTAEHIRRRTEELQRDYEQYKNPPSREETFSSLPAAILAEYGQILKEMGTPAEEELAEQRKPTVSNGLGTSNPKVHYTSENHELWRNAVPSDAGGTIVFCQYDKVFGEFDDTDEEPDEEFPDVTIPVAIVYTPKGMKTFHESSGHFEDLKVVPEGVLKGVKNEAPPGKFFSGKSTVGSSAWTPAPEGYVWFDHPRLTKGPQYLTYFEYYCAKRMIDLDMSHDEFTSKYAEGNIRFWQERASIEFWCPVQKKFMCAGERLQNRHWFHNGDGSAQQRRYYTQFEMLDKYGGFDFGPNADAKPSSKSTGKRSREESDEVVITEVRSLRDVLRDNRKKAEEDGKVIRID